MSINDKRDTRPETQLVQGGRRKEWTGRIVNPPVHRASTITYENCAELKRGNGHNADGAWFYARRGTPTQWALAEAITQMEPEAAGTMLYPSGVAAVSCAMVACLKPGDHLLMVDSAYDPTRSFCDNYLADWGVSTTYYDPLMGTAIETLVQPNTRLIFMESPGSHTFEVQDVPAIVGVAKTHGITTIIDNTWATPLFLKGLGLGVDISICVGTKYLGGHSDVMMGAVSANSDLWPELRRTSQLLGQYVSPDDAFLVSRGMRTLALRMKQLQANGIAVASWLEAQPEVARVLHPGLPSFPGHELWKRDFTGAGGLFGVILKGGNDKARAAMIDRLEHFGIGYSWGGYESLIVPSDPAKDRTATRWEPEGPGLRLSIGLEHVDDLIADLRAGLDRFAAAG